MAEQTLAEPVTFTVQQMERSVDSAYRQGFAAGEKAERDRLCGISGCSHVPGEDRHDDCPTARLLG